jgi:imidazolonepropionase
MQAVTVHDGGGSWLTPGLIDCHTHIVHAGNRSDEFEARLNGATYEDIARAGGGIMSTVRATRAAPEDELLRQSLPRVLQPAGGRRDHHRNQIRLRPDAGIGSAMLRAARRIGRELPVRVATTFLGAHALPPEFAGRADDYIDEVCKMIAPLAAEGWPMRWMYSASASAFRRTDGARVQGRAGARPAGQAACGAAVRPARRGTDGALQGPVGRPP